MSASGRGRRTSSVVGFEDWISDMPGASGGGSPPEYGYHPVKTMPERLAAMEVRVDVIREDVSEMKETLAEIHEIILQGKGAKWAIITFVGVVASMVGGAIQKFFPGFPKL